MRRRKHAETEHVVFDLRRCKACGDCAISCPSGVLGMVALLRHRHVHVDHAERCVGCMKCAESCAEKAIMAL